MIEESSNKYGEIIPLAEVHKNILPIDLPMGYNYRFERFRTIDTVVIKFCAIIRVNIQDELQAMDWLDKFQSVSKVSLKSSCSTCLETSKHYKLKLMKVCQHAGTFSSSDAEATNKHGRSKRRKCIGCEMHLTLGIKRVTKRVKQNCLDLENFPCYVMLMFDHNHNYIGATVSAPLTHL